MFKRLINAIKLHILNSLVTDLCDNSSCRNCPSFMGNRRGMNKPLCAQVYILRHALDKWGTKKEKSEDIL